MQRYIPKQSKQSSRLNEQGFASIVIALVLIIILSLLTIGFAQLARREQQTALNKQLANQAYYAAESGIDDAYKGIKAGLSGGAGGITNDTSGVNSGNCLGVPLASTGAIGPTNNGVSYTCVIVTLELPDIKWDSIAAQSDRNITFSTDQPAGSFTINWNSADGHETFPPTTDTGFTPLSPWSTTKYPGVLQLSITPLTATDRNSLVNNTFTVYLYPSSSGTNNVAYSPVQSGRIVSGNCHAPTDDTEYACSSTISGLSGGTGPYLVHLIDYYDASNVTINGKSSLSGAVPVKFNGQAQIDSTGKAHDVLKRLQVRVPIVPAAVGTIGTAASQPNYSIEVQNICKRFSTYPGVAQADGLDPSCNLN